MGHLQIQLDFLSVFCKVSQEQQEQQQEQQEQEQEQQQQQLTNS